MSQELALKYSSAPLEQLLSVLSPEEAIEEIQRRLRAEVREDVEGEFSDRIAEAEEESCANYSSMQNFKRSAEGFMEAIKRAVDLPWTEALPLLRQALEEHNPYED